MEFQVNFGSAFAIDGFNFVRQGEVAVDDRSVTYTGKQKWSVGLQVVIFLVLTVVPYLIFGIGLGLILALVVIHYFCASDGSISISKGTITDVVRKNRLITFKGIHPDTNRRCKAVNVMRNIEDAERLEDALNRPVPVF